MPVGPLCSSRPTPTHATGFCCVTARIFAPPAWRRSHSLLHCQPCRSGVCVHLLRDMRLNSMPNAVVHALATSPAPARVSSTPEPRTNAGLPPSCARSRSPSSCTPPPCAANSCVHRRARTPARPHLRAPHSRLRHSGRASAVCDVLLLGSPCTHLPSPARQLAPSAHVCSTSTRFRAPLALRAPLTGLPARRLPASLPLCATRAMSHRARSHGQCPPASCTRAAPPR
jgi:hypothetical protein